MTELHELGEEALRGLRMISSRHERRERIATAVLAGFASDSKYLLDSDEAAREAIDWADALIAELDKS